MNEAADHALPIRISDADLARVPGTGALVVICNLALENRAAAGLVQSLLRVRPDVRLLADGAAARVAGMKQFLLATSPRRQGTDLALALRPALEWLASGGMLVLFPATKAVSFDMLRVGVVAPHWRRSAAELVRLAGADVLPVHLALGARKPGTLRIGTRLAYKRLARFANDAELTAYLRYRVQLLAHRAGDAAPVHAGGARPSRPGFPIPFRQSKRRELPRAAWPPVAADVPRGLLLAEAENLAGEQTLVESDEFAVRLARAEQIPHTLREIGRLRELTFRAVGEGTGKPLDIDQFDEHYLHLWLWHRQRQEIAGAYRIGPTDELLPRFGLRGLYTYTVFKFHPSLLDRVFPALEMGRSFVCADYQKSFAPLMLLWRGIGRFIVQNPRYRFLFGPVSISNEYQQFSRQLMIEFLRQRYALPRLARWVKPRLPFRTNPFLPRTAPAACAVVRDVEELSAWVAEIEPNAAGVPILLKHYLKLGGRVLAFNVDPNFSDVVDGLILVDLTASERPTLDRYMGRDGAAAFLNLHRHALPLAG